jgi:hypothetical protein
VGSSLGFLRELEGVNWVAAFVGLLLLDMDKDLSRPRRVGRFDSFLSLSISAFFRVSLSFSFSLPLVDLTGSLRSVSAASSSFFRRDRRGRGGSVVVRDSCSS